MKAMVMTAFGGPEVFHLQDVPDPAPGPLDLLVDVHATAMNPVDCKTRAAPRWGDRAPPMILGFDVSGVVRAVGADVTTFHPGDEIYASPALIRDGANAQLVCIDARSAAPKPSRLSHPQAAALPLVTLTAWECLHHHGQLQPGQPVLIHAGAGGVGHIAIQLAKQHGATVLTTAGRPESIALCQDVGADIVINYRQENVTERVLAETQGQGCPLVIDCVGGTVFEGSIPCVAHHGRLVTIVPGIEANINPLFGKSASLHLEFMGAAQLNGKTPSHQADILSHAAALADAHRQQETGRTLGKQVLTVL